MKDLNNHNEKPLSLPFYLCVALLAFLLQGCPSAPSPTPTTPPTPTPSSEDQPDQAGPTRPSDSDVILSDSNRSQPGTTPTDWLYFQAPGAESVKVSGSWDGWDQKSEMQPVGDDIWVKNIGAVDVPFGRYEFKFIVDGNWEGGANRILTLNEQGQMEKPPEIVAQTLIHDLHTLRVQLYQEPGDRKAVQVEIAPSLGKLDLQWHSPRLAEKAAGFRLRGKDIEFVFDPKTYDMAPPAVHSVVVAGTFSGWNPDSGDFRLERQADGTWTRRISYNLADSKTTAEHLMFKFVVNGEWKNPPNSAPNIMLEPGTPHRNLTIPRSGHARPELRIITEKPIDLRNPPVLVLRGLHESALKVRPTPGDILDTLASDLPMGVTLDRENKKTHYRLFAPRATSVHIGFFEGPYHTLEDGTRVQPAERLPMKRQEDGAWEYVGDGLHIGRYYAFQVEGRHGEGEGFNGNIWFGDPYAKAVSLAEGNSIVMDLNAQPVQPLPRPRVAWEDMVIYETHIRHLTQHPSSGVPEELRGTYPGLLATRGTGTGIDHLKKLGVNVIQFLPIHEFNNGFARRHDWGYASCFFFAPESSYATDPLKGSQVAEFKQLVDELHQEGFAVFMDVVYNHIGGVNVFNQIDRKYYFRLNPDLTNQNFSGCGNDTASERPMFRRLIKESVLFWVEEYGIDGFRFDLCELIDDETLRQIEAEIREKHPHVVLHSEPWSFRGHHKDFLGPTTWGGWNDQFREPAKRFVSGRGDVQNLKKAIRGSVESWTQHPLQSVNYMESHDDKSLTDELSANPDHDGRNLSERDERIHKLAATLIFSSLGTPMITEGQAYMRSKHGIRNTYNQGDRINSLRWEERDRPHARETLAYYREMIAFRLSEVGSALRVADAPSLDYVRFMDPGNGSALGWMVNANAERPDVPAVLVLMNAGSETSTFEVDLPGGAWRQIGNGDTVQPNGIPGSNTVSGNRKVSISVPPQTAWLYRNGF
jgi:pullulanase/glycogen debranching enzyme